MRTLSLVLALTLVPALAAPSDAEAKTKKRRAAPAKKEKAPKASRALTPDDPLLRVGLAKPLTVADAHKPGTPIATPAARPTRR